MRPNLKHAIKILQEKYDYYTEINNNNSSAVIKENPVSKFEIIKSLKHAIKHLKRETKIICLCGSTRFTEQMLIKQWELTKDQPLVKNEWLLIGLQVSKTLKIGIWIFGKAGRLNSACPPWLQYAEMSGRWN